MRALQDPFRSKIAQEISSEIEKAFQLKISPETCLMDLAMVPNLEMGHLAFPCFKLSKELKKSPKDISTDLQAQWQSSEFFSEVRAVGPYLNFFFKSSFIGQEVLKPMAEKNYFEIANDQAKPFIIEYSQPNTHKELHVGHMRNLCFGQSLILLFEFCGNKVVTATFPGDVGTHVAKCLWYMKYHNQEAVPEQGKGEWLGRMYSAAHNKLEDEKGSSKEDENRQIGHRLILSMRR